MILKRESVIMLCLGVVYAFVGYHLNRVDFNSVLLSWFFLFITTYILLKKYSISYRQGIIIGLGLRIIFIGSTPMLSQDFIRYLWDGHIINLGDNPYLFTPNQWLLQHQDFPHANYLISEMGDLSAGNYSNYPPLHQLLFSIAAFFAQFNILAGIISLRLMVIIGDVLVMIFGAKLAHQLGVAKQQLLWYFLNPFIIIELTGNLHFEGIMLALLMAALFYTLKLKEKQASIFFSAAVLLKLIPLIFYPFITNKWSFKKRFLFVVFSSMLILLGFLPFFSISMLENYHDTLGLWFTNFEFNASIYNIIRMIGFEIYGYNIINSVGKIIPFITVLGIGFIWWWTKKDNIGWLTAMLLSLSLYLFLSTTIHPWYLVIPLGLSIFTSYRYVWVWSCLIVLSYSAYSNENFKENYGLIGIEYLLVYAVLIWETLSKKPLFRF